MEKMKDEYPVAAMAEALEVSRSGFFAHRQKGAVRESRHAAIRIGMLVEGCIVEFPSVLRRRRIA